MWREKENIWSCTELTSIQNPVTCSPYPQNAGHHIISKTNLTRNHWIIFSTQWRTFMNFPRAVHATTLLGSPELLLHSCKHELALRPPEGVRAVEREPGGLEAKDIDRPLASQSQWTEGPRKWRTRPSDRSHAGAERDQGAAAPSLPGRVCCSEPSVPEPGGIQPVLRHHPSRIPWGLTPPAGSRGSPCGTHPPASASAIIAYLE